jgi:hypothetical protein
MAKLKNKKNDFLKTNSHPTMNVFKITFRGLMIYVKNFIPLTKVLLFPVFGQIIGMAWIIFAAVFLSQNAAKSFNPDAFTDSMVFIFLIMLTAVLPGFFLFTKAFWEYMITTVSLNSMVSNIIKQGHIKDTQIHGKLVKVKSKDYIQLLLLLSLIWLVGLALPACVLFMKNAFVYLIFLGLELLNIMILTIVSIYLSLCYQVFALENLSAKGTLKRSWNLVEGNFWKTFFLGFIVTLVINIIIFVIINIGLDKTSFSTIMIQPLQPYAEIISNNSIYSNIISTGIMGEKTLPTAFSYKILELIVQMIIGGIITLLLLPFGSACYTLLYLDIIDRRKFKSKKK